MPIALATELVRRLGLAEEVTWPSSRLALGMDRDLATMIPAPSGQLDLSLQLALKNKGVSQATLTVTRLLCTFYLELVGVFSPTRLRQRARLLCHAGRCEVQTSAAGRERQQRRAYHKSGR